MKDPAFLFYSSDFLTGVQDLTMEERGQYISLLCLHHQKGRLNDKMIKLCVGVISEDVLKKFQKDESGLYFNTRLELESEKRKIHSAKQKERAVKGWEKRKEYDAAASATASATANATANATALPLENENENENRIIIELETKNKKGAKFNFKKSLIDFGFYEGLVNDWLDVRKNKKLTNSQTAFKLLESEFLKCENELNIDRNTALKHSVENSWGGFKSDWIKNEQLKNSNNGKQQTGRISNEQRLDDIFNGGKYDHLIKD